MISEPLDNPLPGEVHSNTFAARIPHANLVSNLVHSNTYSGETLLSALNRT